MRGQIILYAEDDPDDLVIFRMAFKRATLPHQLYSVDNGESAIAWLKGEGEFSDRSQFPLPSFLILDLKMPKKSGFEVLEWMRSVPEFRALPAVILSSSDDPGDVSRAYELGATTYFVKTASYLDVMQYLRLLS